MFNWLLTVEHYLTQTSGLIYNCLLIM